ncbi:hypothetical protein OESDEN_08409 [Oesophagostomum dentatum]|uniref:Uncharacterized protein n=1 Tax=Oesophagostomum dentatum TaxID=61180 RepID=A0A0B1T7F2_OESDE|nr:hypothetical protein OESDEN_08409 [Oesophagostomum dentatum]
MEQQHWEHRVQPSSKFSEFRTSSSHSFSAHSNFHQTASNQGFYQRNGQWNLMPSRARGERIYRYDTGPVTRTHPNGTTTINRQTIFIAENGQPNVNLVQRLPGLVELTHVTPPPSVLAMMPPELRRKLKKLQKMKIPPRVINPNLAQQPTNLRNHSFTSSQFRSESVHSQGSKLPPRRRNETGNYRRIHHNSSRSRISNQMPQRMIERQQQQTFVPTANDIRHQQHDALRRRPVKEADTLLAPSITTLAPVLQPEVRQTSETPQAQMATVTVVPHVSTTQPPPTPKLVEVQDMILDAEVIFETTTPHPTTRVEAERIELTRPVVASVQARKVDFDEVLAMDSQYYDEYEEPADEPVESEDSTTEQPTEASSLPSLPTSAPSEATKTAETATTTRLPPIVLPPPMNTNFIRDDRRSNILPGAESMPIALIPPAAVVPSLSENSRSEAEKQVNVLPPVIPSAETTHATSQLSEEASTVSPASDRKSVGKSYEGNTTPQTMVGEDYPEHVG